MARGLEVFAKITWSWIEVALPAEECRPYALVVEQRHRRARRIDRVQGRAFVGGIVMGIEELEPDIELRHRVELGAAADFPEAVVGIAAVADVSPDRREIAGEPGDRPGADRPGHQRGIEDPGGVAVIVDRGIAADDR